MVFLLPLEEVLINFLLLGLEVFELDGQFLSLTLNLQVQVPVVKIHTLSEVFNLLLLVVNLFYFVFHPGEFFDKVVLCFCNVEQVSFLLL